MQKVLRIDIICISFLKIYIFFLFCRYGSVIFFVVAFAAIFTDIIVEAAIDDDWQRLMPFCGLVLYMLFGFLISANKMRVSIIKNKIFDYSKS